ncbi:hypothetical protein CRG98_021307 [Punica granatum]|uniref:PRP1 splicing factor N-terminal domain-containing protein n=1 Tax=Punica granatum TaxID=22663 RepID=A0A2I0JPX8_PUNGR|nr:hypothetical protein CRG98_021307 [Punica granatum]
MSPRRRDRVEDVHDRENLRHLEQRLDQMDQRMDRMLGQLTQQMAALMENQNRRNPNPNSDPDREEIEYDSNSEGNATLFSEEDASDDAFFVAGGDGEPDFDEDDEGDDKDRREARLEQEIEKYRASIQHVRTRMLDVSIEPITTAEYFESGFFPIIRSEAWADIGFRSSMEDVYVCVDNFISGLLGRIR